MILTSLFLLLFSTRIHKLLFSLLYPSDHSFRRRCKVVDQTPPIPNRAGHLNKHMLTWFCRRSRHTTGQPILHHERDLIDPFGSARVTLHGRFDDRDADLAGVDIK
ncbi:hypothetical protein COCC4DRAFT_149917 [Bipolaris maydis ATCC 48331]|uniref:Secreted protein n=2 Tax=Cochliobolus heterostrophus TaxID=5016 RepID=M2TPI3_COCH5|nr:uncharacterized protein COCC4DRAFT_149917 [Bipolaris maydis ATCC 48331]EMD88464.1 hypothetical protein COCHEDRAFT_1032666 [Bipolaris maydis C5]ENI00697.1 hypothetical protein COCC4DRAFT_149917 [Bipolaris maydis ATCC 48331]